MNHDTSFTGGLCILLCIFIGLAGLMTIGMLVYKYVDDHDVVIGRVIKAEPKAYESRVDLVYKYVDDHGIAKEGVIEAGSGVWLCLLIFGGMGLFFEFTGNWFAKKDNNGHYWDKGLCACFGIICIVSGIICKVCFL